MAKTILVVIFDDGKYFCREDKNLYRDNDAASGKGRKVENVDVDDKKLLQ